jgi:hypothetical protein
LPCFNNLRLQIFDPLIFTSNIEIEISFLRPEESSKETWEVDRHLVYLCSAALLCEVELIGPLEPKMERLSITPIHRFTNANYAFYEVGLNFLSAVYSSKNPRKAPYFGPDFLDSTCHHSPFCQIIQYLIKAHKNGGS